MPPQKNSEKKEAGGLYLYVQEPYSIGMSNDAKKTTTEAVNASLAKAGLAWWKAAEGCVAEYGDLVSALSAHPSARATRLQNAARKALVEANGKERLPPMKKTTERTLPVRTGTVDIDMNDDATEIDFLALLLAPPSAEDEARWAAEKAARVVVVPSPSPETLSAESARAVAISAKINAAYGKAAPVLVADPACRCGRCGGTGYLAQFYYVANGSCFDCGGTGRR
jgi:hypothetical protein